MSYASIITLSWIGLLPAALALGAPQAYVGAIDSLESYYQDGAPYTRVCPEQKSPGISSKCRAFEPKFNVRNAGFQKGLSFRLSDYAVAHRDPSSKLPLPTLFNIAGTQVSKGDIVEITAEYRATKDREGYVRKEGLFNISRVRVLNPQPRVRCESPAGANPQLKLYFDRGLRGRDGLDTSTFMRVNWGKQIVADVFVGADIPGESRSMEPLDLRGAGSGEARYLHPYWQRLLKSANLYPKSPLVQWTTQLRANQYDRAKLIVTMTSDDERIGKPSITREFDLVCEKIRY